MPSAHFTSGLIFQVVVKRPSDRTWAVPLSREGSSDAIRGIGAVLVMPLVTSPCCHSSLKAWTPPPLVPRNAKENAGIGADTARTADRFDGWGDRFALWAPAGPDWFAEPPHALARLAMAIASAQIRVPVILSPGLLS